MITLHFHGIKTAPRNVMQKVIERLDFVLIISSFFLSWIQRRAFSSMIILFFFLKYCFQVMFIQSSFCSVLISHNLVIYSSVYLLHFNGSVLVLLLWLLAWDCSVVYQLHLVVTTFFQFIVRYQYNEEQRGCSLTDQVLDLLSRDQQFEFYKLQGHWKLA